MLLYTFIYLICGAVAGFLAGLFGLGGGIITIPALLIIFNWQHIPPDYAMHLAVGTSIAIVLITSSVSILAHSRNKMIHLSIFKKIFLGIVIGSTVGIILSNWMNGIYLQFIYAAFLIFIAFRMCFKNLELHNVAIHLPNNTQLFLSSTALYAFSGLLGLGGGLLMVPYLCHCGISTRQAIATSTLCIIPAALIGTLGFMLGGESNIPHTQFHSGFIYWPAFLGITLASIITVRWGVRVTSMLRQDLLRKSFAIFVAMIGTGILLHSISMSALGP